VLPNSRPQGRVRVHRHDAYLVEGSISPWSSADVLLLDDARVYGPMGQEVSRQPEDCFVVVSQGERIERLAHQGQRARRREAFRRLGRIPVLVSTLFLLAAVLGFGAGMAERTRERPRIRAVSERVRINLVTEHGSPRLELTSGTLDLHTLDGILTRLGMPAVLRRQSRAAWLLSRTLVVRTEAHLTLAQVELRLLSSPSAYVGLEARGGELDVRAGRVTSWDPDLRQPDANVADGRAWVLARDGARLNVVGSRMQMLGYDAPERYGVSWRTPGTDGTVAGATFSGNYYGLYTHDVEPMVVRDSVIEESHSYGLDPHTNSQGFLIEDNVFRDNGKHGMILAVGSSGAIVRNNQSYGNRGHGIVVFDRSDDVSIRNNEVHDNTGSGIDVSGSDLVDVTSNIVYGNGAGITVHDRAAATRVDGNRITGNRGDGIRISSAARLTTLTDNLVDFNYRAGLYLDEGVNTLAARNRVVDNLLGIRLEDSDRAARVVDNTISNNVTDGIELQTLPTATITGNLIRTNGQAAFSVTKLGAAEPFVSGNAVEVHPEGRVRLRDA
jgi:parallel beta-helix repeat protein